MADIFKRHILTGALLVAFAAFLPAAAGFSEEEPVVSGLSLSIEGAIKMALENNRDVQVEENEVEAAKAQLLGALSSFMPDAAITGGYTYRDAVMTFPPALSSSNLTEGRNVGVFMGYNNENTLGMSVRETFFNGGGDIAAYRQARLQIKAAEEALRSRKLAVEFETKRLYYGLILAGETERIAGELVGQAKAHYEDTKKKNDNGTASRFELLQSRVQVSKVEPQLVRANNSKELILAELDKLLGLSVNNKIEPSEKLVYSPVETNEQGFLDEARSRRPELIMKKLGIDISKQVIAGARSASLPQVTGGFDYQYKSSNPDNMISPKQSNWTMGVAVTVPIFDGFAANAKVKEARAKYSEAVLSREDFEEQVALEVRKGCLDIIQADAIIASQEAGLEEAREALKIANVSYESGVATNLDVLDAQVSLSQVEENLSEAIYDHIMAKAYLDRTMGKSSLGEGKDEKPDKGKARKNKGK